jgi:hypothetical protein
VAEVEATWEAVVEADPIWLVLVDRMAWAAAYLTPWAAMDPVVWATDRVCTAIILALVEESYGMAALVLRNVT